MCFPIFALGHSCLTPGLETQKLHLLLSISDRDRISGMLLTLEAVWGAKFRFLGHSSTASNLLVLQASWQGPTSVSNVLIEFPKQHLRDVVSNSTQEPVRLGRELGWGIEFLGRDCGVTPMTVRCQQLFPMDWWGCRTPIHRCFLGPQAESALYKKLCGGAEAGRLAGKSSNLQHFSSRNLVNDGNAKFQESQ